MGAADADDGGAAAPRPPMIAKNADVLIPAAVIRLAPAG